MWVDNKRESKTVRSFLKYCATKIVDLNRLRLFIMNTSNAKSGSYRLNIKKTNGYIIVPISNFAIF